MSDREQQLELFPDWPTDRLQVLAQEGPEPLPKPDPVQVPDQPVPTSLNENPDDRRRCLSPATTAIAHTSTPRPSLLDTQCRSADHTPLEQLGSSEQVVKVNLLEEPVESGVHEQRKT